jgi:hypothetical protein
VERTHQNSSHIIRPRAPSRDSRHRISAWRSPLASRQYSILHFKQSSITQHGVHDHSEPSRQRHTRLLEAAAARNLQRPAFEGESFSGPGQDRVGGFIEQFAHCCVALFGDAADPIDLAGLMAPGHKVKVSARIARLFEPVGVIDAGGKGRGRYAARDSTTPTLPWKSIAPPITPGE